MPNDPSGLVAGQQLGHYSFAGTLGDVRSRPMTGTAAISRCGEGGAVADLMGYDGNVWLVAVLLLLAAGLAGALVKATRAGHGRRLPR
jgi:hypothetical protein